MTVEYLSKITGVTSDGPNGENRQDIIRRMIEEHGSDGSYMCPGRIEISEDPRYDAPRIEVFALGESIGTVSYENAKKVADHEETQAGNVTVGFYYSEEYDVYSARLYTPNLSEPTEKMERTVNWILSRRTELTAPEHNFDEYSRFIQDHLHEMNEPDGQVAENEQPEIGETGFDFGNANPAQIEAITATDGPVLITAGPGTGKTFTLVQRVVYLIDVCGVRPESILIATFTEKAAKELVTRITNALIEKGITININEMYVGTFHSLCLRILKENLEYTRLKNNYRVLDDFDQKYFVADNMRYFKNIDGYEDVFGNIASWDASEKICRLVNKLSEEMVDADVLNKDKNKDIQVAGHILKVYRELLEEDNSLDFSAIQTEAFRLLSENAKVLEELQEKIEYFMIDEYQDTNYIQEKLVFLLGRKRNNICVVGDDDQGLYRFRGATIRNILEFESKFDEGECKVFSLVTNYRSNSDIIDFYNKWMTTTHNDEFEFEWEEDGKKYRLEKTIDVGKESEITGPTVVKISGNGGRERWHEKILRFIRRMEESGKLTDRNQIAFLFNSVIWGNAVGLAEYLEENGIDVYSPRSKQFFDRDEIKTILGCLMLMFPGFIDKLENDDLKYTSRKNRDYYKQCHDLAKEIIDSNEYKDLGSWIEEKAEEHEELNGDTDHAYTALIYQMLGFEPFASIIDVDMDLGVKDLRSARNIAKLTHVIEKYEYLNRISVLSARRINGERKIDRDTEVLFTIYLKRQYDEKIAEYEDESEYAPSGCVSFMTIHQAKGTEFPIVVVDSLDSKPNDRKDAIDKLVEEIEAKKYFNREAFESVDQIKYFDFWRKYYTAFSRAQDLMILTGGSDPSEGFRELYNALPDIDDKSFDLEEFDFESVKDVNIKKSFSFTSHINVYQTCGLQYKFYKELGFAPKRVAAMMFGTLVHQTIEDVHKAVIRDERDLITEDNIGRWFDANYSSLSQAENYHLDERQRENALRQVLRYVERQRGSWDRIREAEVDVSLVMEDYIIEGKIDLIEGDGDTVEIVDFKSERKPDIEDEVNREKIERYKRQLQVYASLVKERTGYDVSGLNLYYTGEEGEAPMISFSCSEEDIKKTIDEFDGTVHKILKNEFEPCTYTANVCNDCDFRHFCRKQVENGGS